MAPRQFGKNRSGFIGSYGWNCRAGGADPPGRMMAVFTKPAETYMFQDHDNVCAKAAATCACGCGGITSLQARIKTGCRHNDGANVAYFDGHVKWSGYNDLNPVAPGGGQNRRYDYNP